MDTVTISAIVFIVIMTISGMASRAKVNAGVAFIVIILEVSNFFQFGYFSGLWPFTAMGIFYSAVLILLGIGISVVAYLDARDAE